MCLNGEIFQVYMYKYAALIKLLVQKLIINLDMFVQHKAVLCCISLLLQDYLQSHGPATGRKMAVVSATIFMAKIERAILSQSNTTWPIFWERFIDDIISIRGTQQISSVKYLFGRPLIPSDLKRIILSPRTFVIWEFKVCCSLFFTYKFFQKQIRKLCGMFGKIYLWK